MCFLWTQDTENQRSSWKSNAKNLNTVKYFTIIQLKLKKRVTEIACVTFFNLLINNIL